MIVKLMIIVEGDPEGSLFNSYWDVGESSTFSLDCSTLPLIRAFYNAVLSKEVSYISSQHSDLNLLTVSYYGVSTKVVLIFSK